MAKKFPGEGKEAASPQQAKPANGHGAAVPESQPAIDPAVLEKIKGIRARVHETFGKVALAMMAVPRYRHLSIADLQQLVLEPLIRDRIAIAQPAKEDGPQLEALAGIAIWASVSAEVDAKIREQIKAGIFPVRLKPEEWTSGDINWLIDVIAPTPKLATAVIANFKQVIKQGDLRIHPLVTRLVDPEALKKMGAAPIAAAKVAADA
ncbi:toxin-activating lysine-acyltransferase [Mesorhizobium sp. LjRoot246]|uniref:toxin-activating lysine-acyltransferase n=1 Tax=Mesorhizobium sp. LjRoot246 TaxID=3342294 RepID=UPI003ED00FBD